MSSFGTLNGVSLLSLTVDRPAEVVYSYTPVADPAWRYTDSNGHEHYWDDAYPTLIWVDTDTYFCDDCRDEHTEGEFRCRLCNETVTPGTRDPEPTVVHGLASATAVVAGDAGDMFDADLNGRLFHWVRTSQSVDPTGSVSTSYVGYPQHSK